ncbi:MAG: peptidoglycan DD-metalloendopeptidase family protein [Rikenellaceae bacterium]
MKRKILFCLAICFFLGSVATLFIKKPNTQEPETEEIIEPNLLFGIEVDNYDTLSGTIASGQTLSVIFERYGLSALTTHNVEKASEPVFKLSNIRANNPYTVFLSKDSTRRLCHFVYEKDLTDYITFSFENDTIAIAEGQKEVRTERVVGGGSIESSLWNSMVANGMPGGLAMELSDIYAWSIDFFGIQKGDSYRVIYDQKYVDSTRIGTGTIYGAWFDHGGKRYYAIPFKQDDKLTYWDQDGNSLRKQFLKAPLQYSRISSRFSNARTHPVLKIVRPHHGVDYAAPSGTPVHTVADGTVIFRGWTNGGGNTVKIKHARQMQTTYMHLKGFAKGLAVGQRVSQGDLIGYVGSTGLSTGPHLDFRLYIGGTAVDPLKAPSEPAEPLAEQNMERFNSIRDRIVAELDGTAADSTKVSLQEIEGILPDTTTVTMPE